MPRVFLPQIPSRIDGPTRLWMPTINTDPAKKWGELVVILPPEASRLQDSAPMLASIRDSLRTFSDSDFLCCIGDPGLLAFAAIAAGIANNGRVKLLKWDRQKGDYILLQYR